MANRKVKVSVKIKRYFRRSGKQIIFLILALVVIVILAGYFLPGKSGYLPFLSKRNDSESVQKPELDVELLTINDYSRPGIALDKINGIVIHYTANPGSTAKQNRDYFEGLKDSRTTKASSHFVIGLDGEIIQCIPSSELSYASNDRNYDTLSVECCHPDESGRFNTKTYNSLVHLTAWLCVKFNVKTENVIRHYDITGKLCPKYYVENQDEWNKFIEDVNRYINK